MYMYPMNHEDDPTETTKMKENMAEPPIAPRSIDSSNNHFENHQNHINGVANIQISEVVQDHHQVDNDQVVINVKAILNNKAHPLLSTKSCCIYKVPYVIRQVNGKAYTPKVVSIGPLHYGNPRLQNMERHKHAFFEEFIDEAKANTSLEDLIKCVRNAVPQVRACYSENIDLIESQLMKLILVDATFIIKLFLKYHDKELYTDDSIIAKPCFRSSIRLDLVLLENQLPFYVIEKLFNQAFRPRDQTCSELSPFRNEKLPSFLELAVEFFSFYNIHSTEQPCPPHTRIKHFTDLLRIFYLQTYNKPNASSMPTTLFTMGHESDILSYSVSELHEAGVKLINPNGGKCLLDLKFSSRGGVLEIPKILVHDMTETLFRNMMALEQCHYPDEPYITNYAVLLDRLINTSKDVDVLVHRGILCSILADSKDVAKLFNSLCKDMVHTKLFNPNYLDICRRLNVFYEDPWNNGKATLRSQYCSTPWQTAASIATILVVIFTFVQTVCSVVQFVAYLADSKFV